MKHLIYIFLLFTCLMVHGQSWDVKISGTVTDMATEKLIGNIPVILLKNDDTLAIQNSDTNGSFLFEVTFSVEHNYSIFPDVEHSSPIPLHIKDDTKMVNDYFLELSKLKLIHDRFDTHVIYEKNEIKNYQNFDLRYFKAMICENPQMCVYLIQLVDPEERKSISKRRKKHFLKVLEANGVNMNQLLFSDEIQTIGTENEDKRSRIEGVVNSMDGNCKIVNK